jgi:ABC-type cobalamin/Fe3+-siderophores transport system ATPase subunit
MNLDNVGAFSLKNLNSLNIILGKNGCGKSYLLKAAEQNSRNREGFGNCRYISPERGGVVLYEAGIEQAILNNQNWMSDNRRKNQSENFRQQSASLFRQIELAELRSIEKEHNKPGYVPRTFDTKVDELNTLLDRVKMVREDSKSFVIRDKTSNENVNPDRLSSGESELISLGIEFLAFVSDSKAGVENILFVDEPDVHLHPDLQDRLAKFITKTVADKPVRVVLATHSTSLLASLSAETEVNVAFMKRGDTVLQFKPVSEVDRKILPIFGAHPLSNVFNEAPILLIEGNDDERIWQQVVRSSEGRIKLYPCVVDGAAHFVEFETEVNSVIEAVYDNAKAYSLRDRDLHPEAIEDVGHVVRMRLACRAAENLMLSDDVLADAQIDWQELKTRIEHWLAGNVGHQYHGAVQDFANAEYDRMGYNLKDIRNILIGLFSNKPWEVLVGKCIAKQNLHVAENSLLSYLGEKVRTTLLGYAA